MAANLVAHFIIIIIFLIKRPSVATIDALVRILWLQHMTIIIINEEDACFLDYTLVNTRVLTRVECEPQREFLVFLLKYG